MKLFFVYKHHSPLADSDNLYFQNVKKALLATGGCTEVQDPAKADALIIKELFSFKEFRYIKTLKQDPLISRYAAKVFTINDDDCATGLLKGVYTSIQKNKQNPDLHISVPHMLYPNKYVLLAQPSYETPRYLGAWYGNTSSSKLRSALVASYGQNPHFDIRASGSWCNYQQSEQEAYVPMMQGAKFSLCPPGWAATSYRIYESMAVGRCPVIISDQYVPPDGPDWSKVALFLPEQNLGELETFLQSHEDEFEERGQYAREAWLHYFQPAVIGNYYAQKMLKLIARNSHHTNEMEFARWNSLHLFWVNKWTIPQRVINKVKKLAS